MKYVKAFESFVSSKYNDSIQIGGSLSYIYESLRSDSEIITEASKADFKPTLTMAKYAMIDRTNANDVIKFGTAVAQQWDSLDDKTKENAFEKFQKLKATFKYQVANIRERGEAGSEKEAAVPSQLAEVADKAKEVYDSRVEPMFKDSGDKTAVGNEEELKKELESLRDQKKEADATFKSLRQDYDDKKIEWDEVKTQVDKKEAINDRISELEAQLDSDE